jgi:hypothetical protein
MSKTVTPIQPRRVVDVCLRATHLLAAGVYAGGLLWGVPSAKLRPWRNLTVVSGTGLLVVEASASPTWPHQGRGLTSMAHVAAFGSAHLSPALARPAVVAATLIGAVGSHLPRSVRKWSVLYGRQVP